MAGLVLNYHHVRPNAHLSSRGERRLLVAVILVGDSLALLAAFALAYFIRFQTDLTFFEDVPVSADLHRWIVPILIPFCLIIFAASQLYNVHYLLGARVNMGAFLARARSRFLSSSS